MVAYVGLPGERWHSTLRGANVLTLAPLVLFIYFPVDRCAQDTGYRRQFYAEAWPAAPIWSRMRLGRLGLLMMASIAVQMKTATLMAKKAFP